MNSTQFKRKQFYDLKKENNSSKISVLIGPRQVGKTTLLKQLQEELGGVFLQLDKLEDYEKINSYSKCMSYLSLKGYKEDQKDFFYVFLDEFQTYEDISILLKNIVDSHSNIKLYITGSSSIKHFIQETLAGRKFIHYIYSLSFEEFLKLKVLKN